MADVLAGLQPVAQQVRQWVERRGLGHREATAPVKSETHEQTFGDMEVRCPHCGAEMILVRVRSASGRVLYDLWAEENVTAASVVRQSETEVEQKNHPCSGLEFGRFYRDGRQHLSPNAHEHIFPHKEVSVGEHRPRQVRSALRAWLTPLRKP